MLFNLFGKKQQEERSESISEYIDGVRTLQTMITKEDALNIPAVAETINFIASTIAGLPVKMVKDNVEIKDYRTKLLNLETGDLLDSNQFKRNLITDMLLNGAGYAYVNWIGNKINSLNYVDCTCVSVVNNTDAIFKDVRMFVQGKEVNPYQMLRITKDSLNGVAGRGLLQTNPMLLNAMYCTLKYEYSNMSTGARRGFLKSEYKLDDHAFKSLKQAWRDFSSTDNNTDVMVLNKGISFENTSSTATETQLNQSKTTNADSVRTLLGVSSNFEDTFKRCFMPIISQLETAYNKFLLLESEKDTHKFVIDCSELLKADVKTRYEAYKTALESGILQVDEVREMENIEPLGMDFVKLSLGNVLYNPKTKEVFTPNTGQITNLENPIDKTDEDGV